MRTRNWQRSKLTSAALLLSVCAACSFSKKSNERAEGHGQLYSQPDAPKIETLPDHQRRIVLVATNDWQGNLEPKSEVARDTHQPQEILVSVGGVDIFARYLNILRHLYPNQVALVDAGNALGGTLAARVSGAEAILGAFQELNYDVIGLSTKDLAAGPTLKKGSTSAAQWLPPVLQKVTTPVLASNLIDLHTAKPVDWGSTVPATIKEVNGVKLGFVNLLGNEKLDPALMNGLYIEPNTQALLKQTRALKLKGAEVIVLLAYGGLQCGQERADKAKLPLSKVNFNTADSGACSTDSDLGRFIQSLTAGMVDVIVTGGGPSKVANVINGIPVVQAFSNGTSFSRVDLVYDRLNKKLLTNETKIHQPTRLCHRFFKETEDCYTEDRSVDHRLLIPATYLGEPVKPDDKMSAWHYPWRERVTFEHAKLVKVQILREKMAQNLRESLGTDAAVVDGQTGSLQQHGDTLSQRDLWRLQGGLDQIRMVIIPGTALGSLRDYLDEAEGYRWSQRLDWTQLEQQVEVLVALPEALWRQHGETWARVNGVAVTGHLAPKLVSDTAVLLESDEVGLVEAAPTP